MGDLELGPAALDGASGEGPVLAFLRVLANESDGQTIGAALAEGLLRECRPTQVSAYFLDESGDAVEERVQYRDPSRPEAHARVPLTVRMPLTDVIRTGEAGAWAMADAAAAYPAVAGWVHAQPDRRAEEVLIVPIRAGGRVVGALLVSLPPGTPRTWRLRTLVDVAATALAVWATPRGTPRQTSTTARMRSLDITERHRRILDGVRRGRTNALIASELGVSVGTVKADLARLYQTFGVSNRDALASVVTDSVLDGDPATPAASQP